MRVTAGGIGTASEVKSSEGRVEARGGQGSRAGWRVVGIEGWPRRADQGEEVRELEVRGWLACGGT